MTGFNLWVGGSGRDLLAAALRAGFDSKELAGMYLDVEGSPPKLPAEVKHVRVRGTTPPSLSYLQGRSELLPLVLSWEELTLDLTQGFRANPKVGSLAMATADFGEEAPISQLLDKVVEQLRLAQQKKLRIIGSMFGGVSTTLTPLLCSRLSQQFDLNLDVIEAYVLLPWFGGTDGAAARRLPNARAGLLKLDEIRLQKQRTTILRVIPFQRENFAEMPPPGERAEDDPWLRRVAEVIFSDELLRGPNDPGGQNPDANFARSTFVRQIRGDRLPAAASADVAAAAGVVANWGLERAGESFGFLAQLQLPALLRDIVQVLEMSRQRPNRRRVLRDAAAILVKLRGVGSSSNESRNDESVWRKLDQTTLDAKSLRALSARLNHTEADAELAARVVAAEIHYQLAIAYAADGHVKFSYDFAAEDSVNRLIFELTKFQGVDTFRSSAMADPLGAGRLLKARFETLARQLGAKDGSAGAAAEPLELAVCGVLWSAALLGLLRFDPAASSNDPIVEGRRKLGYEEYAVERVVYVGLNQKETVVALTHPDVGLVPATALLDGLSFQRANGKWRDLYDAWQELSERVQALHPQIHADDVKDFKLSLPAYLKPLIRDGGALERTEAVLGRDVLSANHQTQGVRLPLLLPPEPARFLSELRTRVDDRIKTNGQTILFKDRPIAYVGSAPALLAPNTGRARPRTVILGVHHENLCSLSDYELRPPTGQPRWE